MGIPTPGHYAPAEGRWVSGVIAKKRFFDVHLSTPDELEATAAEFACRGDFRTVLLSTTSCRRP